MRIAILTATSKMIGGVETFTHLLKGIFKNAGHRVTLLTPEAHAPYKKTLGIRLFGLPYLTAKDFKNQIDAYDLVLANGEFSWNIHHPKAIAVFHGCYYGLAKHLNPYLNFKNRLYLKKDSWIQKKGAAGKTVVTVSNFTKNLLEEQGVRVARVIPNGVDIERFQPAADLSSGRYLCVANQYGSLGYYGKGIDVLNALADRGVPIDCVSNVRPGGEVKWIEPVAQERIHLLYPKYRALIFPSRYEANAIVPLEAMACGVPPIISPVGYADEIRKELPECVVKDWDPESYFLRLQEIEANYEELSVRCRRFAEKHSLEVFKGNWLRFIEQAQA